MKCRIISARCETGWLGVQTNSKKGPDSFDLIAERSYSHCTHRRKPKVPGSCPRAATALPIDRKAPLPQVAPSVIRQRRSLMADPYCSDTAYQITLA